MNPIRESSRSLSLSLLELLHLHDVYGSQQDVFQIPKINIQEVIGMVIRFPCNQEAVLAASAWTCSCSVPLPKRKCAKE